MSNNIERTNSSALTSEDYEEIFDAVMETSRGRWFLSEFAKHNRNADTQILLDAIAKLEATIPSEIRPVEDISGVRAAIAEMASEINATKRELQTIGRDGDDPSDISNATAELDAVVEATEGAASDILEAAEAVQEMAWTLREENVADAYCDALDMRATEIYTACSFQDITGQRTKKVVGLLQNLDQRISTLAKIWADPNAPAREAHGTQKDQQQQKADAHLLNGPALAGEGVSQSDIDDMLDATSWSNDTQSEMSAEASDAAAELEVAEDDVAESNIAADSAAEDFAAAEMNAEDMIAEAVTTDELVTEDLVAEDLAVDTAKEASAVASFEEGSASDAAVSETAIDNESEDQSPGVAFKDLDQKDMDALFA